MSPKMPSIHDLLQHLPEQARGGMAALPTFGGIRTIAWLAAGLLIVAVIYLVQSSNASFIARNLRVKDERIAALERENSQLRYDISTASSPKGIWERAVKLGLGPAKNVVYTTIPVLQGDVHLQVASFAPQTNPVPLRSTARGGSIWDQVGAVFGLGESSQASAETK